MSTYTWQEHEPFHLRFCQGLYCKEIRRLPVGNVYVANAYDEPGVLLFSGRNVTHPIHELISQVKLIAEDVGQPACFYVTPTWENPSLAEVQLRNNGCALEAEVSMYHKLLAAGEMYDIPVGLTFMDTVDGEEFKEAYEAAFDGHPGWEPFMGPNLSGVFAKMIFLKNAHGKLLGFAGAAWEGTTGLVFSVGVPASERGKGYGKVIVQGVLSLLAGKGVKNAAVGILASNATSIGLHEGLGFRVFAQAGWWELKN